MRVIGIRAFGPPEVLGVDERPEPEPEAGQAVVAVEAASVIYGDVIVRSGRYPVPLPYVPGVEVGGEVVAVGPGTDRSLLGRRVVATTAGNAGGYAERALVPVAWTFPVPNELPLATALAVFQAGAVASGMLAAMRVRDGETVLITAAAGRIGSMLVQLAKASGATVIGAAGARKLATVEHFGADHAVDYGAEDWPDRVRGLSGGGVDVVFDAVGGEIAAQALRAAADGRGRFGVYGFASGAWLPLDAQLIARRGLTVAGPLGVVFAKPEAEQRSDAERALAAAADGRLRPRIHATSPLDRAADAHAEIEKRRSAGAVLLTA
jgi:NADPH2:quinone reductase